MKRLLHYLRKRLMRIVGSLLITLLFILHALRIDGFSLPLLDQFENIAYDLRIQLNTTGDRDPRIVIIDIDERSLALEGRWPWGRDRVAELVDLLFDEYSVGLLGMDVVWAERDYSSGLKTLERMADDEFAQFMPFKERLDALRPSLDWNNRFVESIRGRPVVLGYYFDISVDEEKGSTSGQLPRPDFDSSATEAFGGQLIRAGGYGANLPELQQVAMNAGHFTPFTSPDGIVRSIPMLIRYGDGYYGSLALAIGELIFGEVEASVYRYDQGEGSGTIIESLVLGERVIPVDEHGRALIPYRGGAGSFAYISATDIFNKRVDPGLLEGSIALLGPSAPGLVDLRATPVGANVPGVELHASMIAGILDQNIMQRPQYTQAIEFLVMLLIGLVMAFLLPGNRPLWDGLISLTLLAGVFLLNLALWDGGQVVPLAASLILVALLFIFNITYGFFVEARGKRQLTRLFCQYVPPEQVAKMSRNPENFSQQGISREMTVLFSDVRDFTSISEHLTPLALHQLMNEYLTPMTEVIHARHGTIDKYMGDAIMAFWGAPLDDPQHARHALLAARDMMRGLGRLNTDFKRKGWPELRVGIGVNTGEMVVGDMGSRFRQSYTVMGDAVNTGSRLEGLTKEYGICLIISEATRLQVPEIRCRELDRVRVKGKDQAVGIYEPIFDDTLEDPRLATLSDFEAALEAYRAMDWDAAEEAFRALRETSHDERLYATYLDRIAHFRENPPPAGWDGVFVHSTK